jgi:hypothetical protein
MCQAHVCKVFGYAMTMRASKEKFPESAHPEGKISPTPRTVRPELSALVVTLVVSIETDES